MREQAGTRHGQFHTGRLVGLLHRSAEQRRLVHARFEALHIPKILHADLALHPDDSSVGLAGSGLVIVNPPYGADDYLARAYAAVHKGLAKAGAGYVQIGRLTPERMA